MDAIHTKIRQKRATLERLKAAGIFPLPDAKAVPVIRPRGKYKYIEFPVRNGQHIGPGGRRRVSVPERRDPVRAASLLDKLQRTEEAAKLMREIDRLEAELTEETGHTEEAAKLVREINRLEAQIALHKQRVSIFIRQKEVALQLLSSYQTT